MNKAALGACSVYVASQHVEHIERDRFAWECGGAACTCACVREHSRVSLLHACLRVVNPAAGEEAETVAGCNRDRDTRWQNCRTVR
eukprot:6209245-Pleurochrysis_carterae.AAC.5